MLPLLQKRRIYGFVALSIAGFEHELLERESCVQRRMYFSFGWAYRRAYFDGTVKSPDVLTVYQRCKSYLWLFRLLSDKEMPPTCSQIVGSSDESDSCHATTTVTQRAGGIRSQTPRTGRAACLELLAVSAKTRKLTIVHGAVVYRLIDITTESTIGVDGSARVP